MREAVSPAAESSDVYHQAGSCSVKMIKEKVRTEEFRVEDDDLLAKAKELVHEGDIRRITLNDDSRPVAVKGQMC